MTQVKFHYHIWDYMIDFNLSGLQCTLMNILEALEPVPRYSYRYTNALGLGTIFLGDDLHFI